MLAGSDPFELEFTGCIRFHPEVPIKKHCDSWRSAFTTIAPSIAVGIEKDMSLDSASATLSR